MAPRVLRSLAISSAVVVSCALATAVPVASQTATDKTIYLSVLDEGGNPVTDLKTEEVKVREDGVDREVVDVKLATDPLYVAVLVDTTRAAEPYIQDIRKAMASFAQRIGAASADARISVVEFGQAAVPLVPFTTDREKVDSVMKRLYPKRTGDSVLLEALVDTTDTLGRQSSMRRAIVVFTIEPGREGAGATPQRVEEGFQKSGAQLWALSLRRGTGLTENSQRDNVLNVLTKATGGVRETIVAESAIESYLVKFADTLTAQYAVTYKRPASERPKMVQTGVTRPGALKLHATVYAPR